MLPLLNELSWRVYRSRIESKSILPAWGQLAGTEGDGDGDDGAEEEDDEDNDDDEDVVLVVFVLVSEVMSVDGRESGEGRVGLGLGSGW